MRLLRFAQLEAVIERFRPMRAVASPSRGWIHEIRTVLGMSTVQMAQRMGISQPAISRMEAREADGSLTLKGLRQAANALDCDVVYALVPRRGSLDATLRGRADRLARMSVAQVAHSMALEDQAAEQGTLNSAIKARTQDLLDHPRALWADPDAV